MTEQQQAAMRQALEALKIYEKDRKYLDVCRPAIRAIESALEQQPAKRVKVWEAEGYEALMQEMQMVKARNIRQHAEIERLSALVRAQQITIDKLEQQPADEPVAWMHKQGNYKEPSLGQLADDELARGWEQQPLYTRPQPAAPAMFGGGLVAIKTLLSRDPCAHAKVAIEMIDAMLAQPAAQWQGLTNKEIYYCEPKTDWYDSVEFARAIEAKLRSKNGGDK